MESSGAVVGAGLPWRTRITVSLLSLVTDSSRRSNGTINRRLLRLFDFRSPPTPKATRGVSSSDHTIDASRNLWFRLFVPDYDNSSLPVLLFFHGGGFAFLSADSFVYDAVCRNLARLIPAVVVSVNYRLSPEHRHPCQYDDGFDALNFIGARLEHLLPPGGPAADISRCFLGGDSAGANLAHHVAVRACREKQAAGRGLGLRVRVRVRVVGVIAIQPFFGGVERTEAERRLRRAPIVTVERTDWMWKAFLPEGADRDHPSANVSGPNAEDISGLSEYPKTVVVVGGLDPLQDWQRRYFEWLRSSGKEAILLDYPDMIHAFYIFPELPQSHRLLLQIKDFVASLSF